MTGPDDRICPRCQRPLHAGGEHRLVCDGCRGVFFERAAVGPMLEALRQLPPGPAAGSPYRTSPDAKAQPATPALEVTTYLRCPFCDARMNRTRLVADLRIVVDMCTTHGVWFDEGELELAGAHLRAREVGDSSRVPAALLRKLFQNR